jgi:hypothetical protein
LRDFAKVGHSEPSVLCGSFQVDLFILQSARWASACLSFFILDTLFIKHFPSQFDQHKMLKSLVFSLMAVQAAMGLRFAMYIDQ